MASGGGFRCPKSKIVAGKSGTLLLGVVPGRELRYLRVRVAPLFPTFVLFLLLLNKEFAKGYILGISFVHLH